MIKYKLEFYVGIFVLLGIISTLILIFKISDVKNIYKNQKTYKLKATFKNIGMLKKKANVTIGGVNIGCVDKIELKQNSDQEYYPHIEMLIDHNINNIPIDSIINILMSSILGDSYIQIETGIEDKYLKDGDTIILTTQALILEELISKFTLNKL